MRMFPVFFSSIILVFSSKNSHCNNDSKNVQELVCHSDYGYQAAMARSASIAEINIPVDNTENHHVSKTFGKVVVLSAPKILEDLRYRFPSYLCMRGTALTSSPNRLEEIGLIKGMPFYYKLKYFPEKGYR